MTTSPPSRNEIKTDLADKVPIYEINWDSTLNLFVGRCEEFPGMMAMGLTVHESYLELRSLCAHGRYISSLGGQEPPKGTWGVEYPEGTANLYDSHLDACRAISKIDDEKQKHFGFIFFPRRSNDPK